jgi:hypothetical protein
METANMANDYGCQKGDDKSWQSLYLAVETSGRGKNADVIL